MKTGILSLVVSGLAVLVSSAVQPGAGTAASALQGEGVALIYNGASSARGGHDAVAAVARRAGLRVEFIGDLRQLPERLKGVTVFAVGGTDDNLAPLLRSIPPEAVTALKDYLRGGGRYWGICGGAYIASAGWDEKDGFTRALGLVEARSAAWLEQAPSRIITVVWQGERRPMYYQYGPAFEPPLGSDARIVATYDDGRTAGFVVPYGKGRIGLVGPHPEADDSWLQDTPPPIDAGAWKPTMDLAVAMLRDLLAG